MSEYVELAYAAATSRLCLFTGTGFSKAVSNSEAPTWKELLKKFAAKFTMPKSWKTRYSLMINHQH